MVKHYIWEMYTRYFNIILMNVLAELLKQTSITLDIAHCLRYNLHLSSRQVYTPS
jgi:hypothetical protein